MSDQAQPTSGIDLETSFHWIAFLLHFFPPKVVVNGYDPGKVVWGSMFIPLAPGRHQVRVYFPYLFIEAGNVTGTIDVHEGHVTSVQYKAPTWFVFSAGKLTVRDTYPTGSRPMSPVPPVWGGQAPQPVQATAQPQVTADTGTAGAWHADPMGRHELRYWDGPSWTDHVSDQGVHSADAVG